MQEPSSPLVPLDPTLLQQQMQQPMRNGTGRGLAGGGVPSSDLFDVAPSASVQHANSSSVDGRNTAPSTPQQNQNFVFSNSGEYSPMPSSTPNQRVWCTEVSPQNMQYANQQKISAQGLQYSSQAFCGLQNSAVDFIDSPQQSSGTMVQQTATNLQHYSSPQSNAGTSQMRQQLQPPVRLNFSVADQPCIQQQPQHGAQYAGQQQFFQADGVRRTSGPTLHHQSDLLLANSQLQQSNSNASSGNFLAHVQQETHRQKQDAVYFSPVPQHTNVEQMQQNDPNQIVQHGINRHNPSGPFQQYQTPSDAFFPDVNQQQFLQRGNQPSMQHEQQSHRPTFLSHQQTPRGIVQVVDSGGRTQFVHPTNYAELVAKQSSSMHRSPQVMQQQQSHQSPSLSSRSSSTAAPSPGGVAAGHAAPLPARPTSTLVPPQMYIIGGGGGTHPTQTPPRFPQALAQPRPSVNAPLTTPSSSMLSSGRPTGQQAGPNVSIVFQQQQPTQHGSISQTGVATVSQMQPVSSDRNSQQPQPQYFGHDPSLNVPADMCLVGCSFLIVDYERLLDQKEVSDWKICIVQHGGEVESAYLPKCTHIICDSLRNPLVQQAVKESKRCVTAQWLNDCVTLKRMQPPWKIVHFPSPYGDNKPCKNRIFAVSGFDSYERLCIRHMAMAVGARYTSYLSRHNTLLVAKCLDGEKVVKAIEWKIPIVNVQWLIELFLGQQSVLQSVNNPKYHQFLTKEALHMVHIDLFRIEPSIAPISALLTAWRNVIQVTVECWKTANERKHKLEDDTKLFPHKKLRLSPAPDDAEIQIKRREFHNNPDFLPPRISFTGFYNIEVENLAKKSLWLGAIVESNVKDCTHLVSPDLKRTRKLLEGLALSRLIVSPVWIRQSFKQQRFLDCLDYIVKDEGNEKFFGFNIKLSIYRAKMKPLFEDVLFYLTPSIQPSPTVLIDLIQTSGGTVLHQKPSSAKILELQQNGIRIAVITCDNDLHLCQHMMEIGIPVQSSEFILTGILRQEVDFQSYRIEVKPSHAITENSSSSKSSMSL